MKATSEPCAQHDERDQTDHYASGGCETPYCDGWIESRCRRCGWFYTSCRCGFNNGQSRNSYRHQRAMDRRREARSAARRSASGAAPKSGVERASLSDREATA